MTSSKGADFLSSAELTSVQNKAWQKQRVYVIEQSAFYQDLWEGNNLPVNLEDLPSIPLSTKADLRISQENHPPFGNYLAASPDKITRMHRTSGTTGQAMNLALSAKDCHLTEQVGGRSHRAAGLTAKHTVVHCLNYQMWMGGVTDHLTLEKTGATVVPFGVGSTELLIQSILSVGINAISCTPSYPAVLERVLEEKFPKMKPRDLGLKLGLFGGEPGLDDPSFRKRLTDVWGMEVRNANYGVSDVLSNFAAQCTHDNNLHFMAGDVLYPELINPETTAPLPLTEGQKGELVLTHLERECQPLVRFRTGDIITITNTKPCRCGRTGFRFRVVGRSDDMVVVRGLNLFPTMVAAILGEHNFLSGNYRITLGSPPPYDALPVQAELARNQQITPQLTEIIERDIKKKLGASAKVTLLPFGSLPVTEGKTNRVVRSYQ